MNATFLTRDKVVTALFAGLWLLLLILAASYLMMNMNWDTIVSVGWVT
jgi:hypothetical protein